MSKDKSTPVGAKRALASEAATAKGGRFSAPRKAEAVLCLLRGEDLELLSRELGVTASTLSLWRQQFLAAGQAALKGKAGKTDERDEQISRLKKKVGESSMRMSVRKKVVRERLERLAVDAYHMGINRGALVGWLKEEVKRLKFPKK